MSTERPDEEETWREDAPPGAVSDQNQEEAEEGHGKGQGERRQPPRTEEGDDAGSSSEGSQSTGHPEHAG